MNEETFQCEVCKGIFNKAWSDEEAEQEALEFYGEMPEDPGFLCDDCWEQFKPWYESQRRIN